MRGRAIKGAGALLAGFLWVALMQPAVGKVEKSGMDQTEQDFGKPNPKAPAELGRFAFLIGKFKCAAKFKTPSGEWQAYQGMWTGRYILDGYVIEDEYRMTGPSGELVVLGMNYRVYDAEQKIWKIRWLNALAGTWMDLGTPELGGVKFDGQSVSYEFKEEVAGHAYTRASYTNISKDHFTWRGEASVDMKAWSEFMVIEANRVK